ncbi:MAG: ATP-dependent helicase DeaD [Patescibacteria group bacterium]|nr:ATP-dependent helicase DeaD [Patescibacteria group bacterium]
MKTFAELGLKREIQQGLVDINYQKATPIQEQAIPFILKNNQDLIALAQTGTGKTAAFGLPILNKLEKNQKTQALILCPTRELCLQISREIKSFTKYLPQVKIATIYGGARMDGQIQELKAGANIVVGTPGRVHDMLRRLYLRLDSIRFLVLDEADEMLDMGFKDDLDEILIKTPKIKQILLFSATMSPVISKIAQKYMNDPQEISVGKKNIGADKVEHEYYLVKPGEKYEALRRILDAKPNIYGILFCRTRHETQEIADKLKEDHYLTAALHGDISQNLRTQIMDQFREQKIQLLVATDVAARGIDVNNLSHVINYSLPDSSEVYLHRSGRTGRAEKSGISLSIFTPRELRKVSALERVVGKKFVLKAVPKGEEICQSQLFNLLKKIKNTKVEEKEIMPFMPLVEEAFKDMSREEVITRFTAMEFNHFLNLYKNKNDLETVNSKQFLSEKKERLKNQSDDNFIDVKLNVGRFDKFDIKALFGFINSQRELKGAEIGRIKIDDTYTIFGIEKNKKEEARRVFKRLTFKGKPFKVEIESKVEKREGKVGIKEKYNRRRAKVRSK